MTIEMNDESVIPCCASKGLKALTGFPTGVENMGGSLKFDGSGGGRGRLKSIHGVSMEGLKTLLKNTCEGVYLLVKLPAINLQASKFTKYELLHAYFSRILARF